MAPTSASVAPRNSLRSSIGPAVQPPSSVYIGTALNIGNQSSFCPSYHASGRIRHYPEAKSGPLWRESGTRILALGDRHDLKLMPLLRHSADARDPAQLQCAIRFAAPIQEYSYLVVAKIRNLFSPNTGTARMADDM